MSTELTQIDGTYQNVAANGDEKDWDADASRWTKGDNDRLYVDGTKFVDYVALDSLVVITQGSGVSATATIEGDELTLEITRDDGINHKAMSATFALPDGLAEDEEDEQEIVTDGGEDVTDHVDDETIETAIEDNGADGVNVEDVRDALASIQHGTEQLWGEYMDVVEEGTFELVAEDGDVLVFADHGGHEWGEIFDAEGIDDPVLRRVIMQVQHAAAKSRSDYSWSTSEPIVVRKPDGFDDGQLFVEAVVNGLQARGLSPGQAWAYYGVEIRGNSRNNWGLRKGDHDHKNVSDALEKAREKLP